MSAKNEKLSPVLRAMACLCWSVGLASCAVGPDFVRPAAPAVSRYTRDLLPAETVVADGQAQRYRSGENIVPDWWRFFESTELDAIVARALADNPTLQSAQASLRESQHNLQAGYGVFFPEVDANFGVNRQKPSPFRFGGYAPTNIFNLYTLGASITYALDVFGGKRRMVEGLEAQADYQRYQMIGTYMSLSGNVVNACIAQAAYQAQIQATEKMIELQKEQLRLTKVQTDAGIVPYTNVLSIQSQLSANEAILPALRQKRVQAEHLLSTLSGHLPEERSFQAVDFAKLKLPQELPVSLPSTLVRQRPDILAAEAQLHAASANVGVATADLFPSFTLSGSYGLSNTKFSHLSDATSKFWSVGPTLSFPLFQGGTAWYRRQAAIDAYQKSLADYRQTVLTSFQQVADTLKALEHDAQGLQAQADALRTAEEAWKLRDANYRAGLVGYLDVLSANAQFYQAKINYLQISAQRYQDTAALFVALGGGWWSDPKFKTSFHAAELSTKEQTRK